MTMFLLFSIPLTYLLINSLFNNHKIKKRTIITPFIYGLILSIPYLLIYWAVFKSFFNNWTPGGLYFYHFFNKEGFLGVYSALVLYLIYSFLYKESKGSRLRELTALVSGLYFSIAIYDFLVSADWYGSLELFISPVVRIVSILLISLFLSRSICVADWHKYLWLGAALLVPVLFVFISLMVVVNLQIFSIIILILLFSGAVTAFYLEVKGRLITF